MIIERANAAASLVLAALHEAGMDNGRAWEAAEFARLLAAPGAFACIASEQGEPIGFVLGWSQGDDAEVLTIAVVPPARRRGAGRALLDSAIAAAREARAMRLILEVSARNAGARALYQSVGFVQSGVRKGYYDAGATDALVLVRALG